LGCGDAWLGDAYDAVGGWGVVIAVVDPESFQGRQSKTVTMAISAAADTAIALIAKARLLLGG
jgi:uncharacterized membrane protein